MISDFHGSLALMRGIAFCYNAGTFVFRTFIPTLGRTRLSVEVKADNERPMERVILVETPIPCSDAVDFDAIVTGHGRLLFGIAYAVLRNPEDAEDVVQETFIRAFRSGDIGKVERMQPWLGRIAWRLALNRRKRRAKNEQDLEREALARTLPIQEAGAEALLLKKEREAMLERLLRSLPDELRETVVLLAVDGISSPVAAEILGIAESSVRDRLLRARKLMKQKLSAVMERDHGA